MVNERIAVAAAVNNREILRSCLARSPDLADNKVAFRTYEDFRSAAAALNAAIRDNSAPLLVLAHQDVYLPTGWLEAVMKHIESLDEGSTPWAVCGVVGLHSSGGLIGRVWSTGLAREVGKSGFEIAEAVSIDECVIILNCTHGLLFDEMLPDWHLYGTDIVLQGHRRGLRSFVIEAPVVHNSRAPKSLRGGYARAYRYMQRKWKDSLPAPTLIAPLTHGSLSLWRSQFRRFKKRLLQPANVTCASLDARAVAQKLGYERR